MRGDIEEVERRRTAEHREVSHDAHQLEISMDFVLGGPIIFIVEE